MTVPLMKGPVRFVTTFRAYVQKIDLHIKLEFSFSILSVHQYNAHKFYKMGYGQQMLAYRVVIDWFIKQSL